jgi:hypothetical protein
MKRRTASVCLAAAILAVTPTSAQALGNDTLRQAREFEGYLRPPPQNYGLPGARLHVSPVEVLAGGDPQALRFRLRLNRAVGRAVVRLRLPEAWTAHPAGGLETTIPARMVLDLGGAGTVQQRGRTILVNLRRGVAGDVVELKLTDIGVEAGTYRLPITWTENGHRQATRHVEVRIYAPDREGSDQPGASGRATPASVFAAPLSLGLDRNTSNDTKNHSETDDVVVPGNPSRFAASDNNDDSGVYLTDNGGMTFKDVTPPTRIAEPGGGTRSLQLGGDAMFAADAAGNIWFGGLEREAGGRSRIFVDRIPAGTDSFQPTLVGLKRTSMGQAGQQDKNLMTIDNSPTSPTYGRLYVIWGEPGVRIVLVHCDTRVGGRLDAARCDSPNNWSAPVAITPRRGSYIYADAAVGPDGTVFATWWDYSSANAIRGASCNPGKADCDRSSGWSTKTIATLNVFKGQGQRFECPTLAQPGGRTAPAPTVAVDHSGGPNNGRVYVAWGQLRAGSGRTRCANRPARNSDLSWDVYVASAGNALPGGARPSPQVATRAYTDGEDGGARNSDEWFPTVAVDQTNGQAWVDFYSTRQDPARKKADFFLRAVTPRPGGHNLGSLVRVTSQSSNESFAKCCNFGNDYGDYTGLDATSGVVFPAWTDARQKGDEQLYTASVPEARAR